MLSFLNRFQNASRFYIANSMMMHFAPYVVRHWYLRRFCGMTIGYKSSIAQRCFITGRKIMIGSNTVVNRYVYLDGRAPLYIGNNVNVSHYVLIHTLTHDPQNRDFICIEKPVAIMDHAWIGARAIILPGVTIGEGAVVGAGSVVTRDVPPYKIVAGNPAMAVRDRSRDIAYRSSYFPFFDTDIQ